MTGPADTLRAMIARQGPVAWSTVIECALYGAGGFYTSGGGAGRHRDFLTSPEVGPTFGAVVARAIDAAWVEAGRPDPWFVVEAGAGTGTMARAVLASEADCLPALRYLAVEGSPALREAARARLPVESASEVLGPWVAPGRGGSGTGSDDGDDDEPTERHTRRGLGPMIAVLERLPSGPLPGVVFANELLDNLPFDIYESTADGWAELRVRDTGDAFTEIAVPARPDVARALEGLVPSPGSGCRVPWQAAAAAWIGDALTTLGRGRVIVVDYARPTAELALLPVGAWLRTYRAGGPGRPPLDVLGAQDITVDVALDQLPAPARTEPQAAWLVRHGIEELASSAAATWAERAAIGDLVALRARSVAQEVAALTDPAGLGGFTVCEWDVPARA